MAGLALLAGCTTDGGAVRPQVVTLPVDANGLVAGTGFDAADVKVACRAMQRGLESVPAIGHARRAVQIVVEPIINDTRLAVETTVFERAVREQLAAWAPRPWHFESASPASSRVDYYLAGRLQHLKPLVPTDGVTLLYSFQLIDAGTSEIVWEGTAELKNRSFQDPVSP